MAAPFRVRFPVIQLPESGPPNANGSSNGVEHVTVNGDGSPKDDAAEDSEPEVQYERGMKNGFKSLFGTADKQNRYTWKEKIPDDLGKPAENKRTSKWALIVRKVRKYNDPSKVLEIHSIAVQSPLLKKLLAGVLKGYPGITPTLERLEFGGRFEPLIHRWEELQNAIDGLGSETEDDRTTKAHAMLLKEVLMDEFQSLIETSQDMKRKKVMTFEHLWTLFQPGSLVYMRNDGQETALHMQEAKYGVDAKGLPVFWVIGRYVDYDGTRFGYQKLNVSISAYSGTRPINSLAVFPLEYHHDAEGLRTRLVERGARVEALAGPSYRAYDGMAWRLNDQTLAKDKYNVKGRIMIDTYGWNRFNPAHAVYVSPLTQKQFHGRAPSGRLPPPLGSLIPPPAGIPPPLPPIPPLPGSIDLDSGNNEPDAADDYVEENDCGEMPFDGKFASEDEVTQKIPLTTEQKLICSPVLRGYSLKHKLWLNFFVNCVEEIQFQTDAFEKLVLPENQKELILGFTETQVKCKGLFDDFIQGKGRGMIILLCGPPGVGKTLTAEAVAEEMRVPLYAMSAGDLGLMPRAVESQLQQALEICTRFSACLLLDEADIFLEKRSLHEIERNKLVSIFLRVLEYYEGIMFLTTNRVETFDPAFASRIHISINYPELSMDSRTKVWKNFLEASPQEHTITSKELASLSRMNLNGRQIKNILKIARLLASRKNEKLRHDHIMTTLEVTQHLHNESQISDRTRETLYH
ncbi:P-loop containing nucleoside triphosphate hydrolase protein [Westerdykella ornata]|uniref:P-loop containing nucleoside triphosphate hydrolase protein n=1 Tax=Westerdykella ornata TaxID=318751 RepID=A0A6A6JNV7_WESOR|nr:P-loop containing nucleoside triphosphate hydrolase protein [Westerdykella ornata]KAF2276619.1 P-loop containing nucleoside triphosphate hydrolase protein [Westerdykella ornata]